MHCSEEMVKIAIHHLLILEDAELLFLPFLRNSA